MDFGCPTRRTDIKESREGDLVHESHEIFSDGCLPPVDPNHSGGLTQSTGKMYERFTNTDETHTADSGT